MKHMANSISIDDDLYQKLNRRRMEESAKFGYRVTWKEFLGRLLR